MARLVRYVGEKDPSVPTLIGETTRPIAKPKPLTTPTTQPLIKQLEQVGPTLSSAVQQRQEAPALDTIQPTQPIAPVSAPLTGTISQTLGGTTQSTLSPLVKALMMRGLTTNYATAETAMTPYQRQLSVLGY